METIPYTDHCGPLLKKFRRTALTATEMRHEVATSARPLTVHWVAQCDDISRLNCARVPAEIL